jgi:hypothetical protein
VVLAAKLAYECPVRATTEARLVGLCDLPAPNFWPGPGTPLNRGATDPRRSGTAEPTRRLLITTSCGLLKQPYTQKPSNVRDLYPKVSRLQPAFRPGSQDQAQRNRSNRSVSASSPKTSAGSRSAATGQLLCRLWQSHGFTGHRRCAHRQDLTACGRKWIDRLVAFFTADERSDWVSPLPRAEPLTGLTFPHPVIATSARRR